MLGGQQKQPEMRQKRLRILLRITVEASNVAVHVGLVFLLIQIVSNNPQALANWPSWMLIVALEICIMLAAGAARSAVGRIGKPTQSQQAIDAADKKPDILSELSTAAMQRFQEALSAGREGSTKAQEKKDKRRETYARVKADLSARYTRAKNGEY